MLTQTFFSSHLLCYYLEQSTKTSLVPGHPSFLSLPLHLTCMDPSLFSLPLIFLPLTTLESVCFSFCLFDVSFQSYTFSLLHVSNRLLQHFSTRHTLAYLTSSLPAPFPHFLSLALHLFSVCFPSCGCCIVNTLHPMANLRASFLCKPTVTHKCACTPLAM